MLRSNKIALQLQLERLPDGLFWYECAGQVVFPAYAATGGLRAEYCAILIDKVPQGPADFGLNGVGESMGGRWYTIKIDATDDEDSIKQKMIQAIKTLRPNGN